MLKNLMWVSFIGAAILATHCSNNTNPVAKSEPSDRIAFANQNEFQKTYSELAQLSSREDLEWWASQRGHSTLLYSEDSTVVDYSDVLKTILNKNSEYEVGTDIIWFHNGNLYSTPKCKDDELTVLKSDCKNFKIVGSIYCKPLAIGDDISSTSNGILKKVSLGASGSDARWQKEFTNTGWQKCPNPPVLAGGKKKFVNGIKVETFVDYETFRIGKMNKFTSYVYLVLKLEYWAKKRTRMVWKPYAGEHRQMSVNVLGNATMNLGSTKTRPITIQNTYGCSTDQSLQLASDYFLYSNSQNPSLVMGMIRWDISLSGTIYQYMLGDAPGNAYTVQGTLW